MTEVGAATWPLEGYFHCAGNSLFVKLDCLGEVFESRTANRPITIMLPQFYSPEPNALLARPPWRYVHKDRPEDALSHADVRWGTIGSAIEPNELFPTYAVVRSCLVYTDIEAGDEWEFRTNVSAFARELDQWWTALTDWLGVISVQDFVGLGRRQRSILEYTVHAWTGDDAGHRHTTCGSAESTVPGEPDKLTKEQLRQCMRLARKCNRPTIEWRLIADARSLSRAGEHRRAVLEAGTAAEMALTSLLETHLYPAGDAIREALLDRKTLGALKDLALKLIPDKVPQQLKDDLITPRNAAVHKATEVVSQDTAQKAIAKAAEVVQQAYPLD